jgi:hypothetical protein
METRRIRYVFTVVTTICELPQDPLLQRSWLQDTILKLRQIANAEQVGVVGVLEVAD